jgi:hypothetical protein
VPLNVAHAHPAGIHPDDLVVETGEATLVLGYELGLEAAAPVARNVQLKLAGVASRGGGVIVGVAFATLALGPSWFWALPASFIAGLGFYMLHDTPAGRPRRDGPNAGVLPVVGMREPQLPGRAEVRSVFRGCEPRPAAERTVEGARLRKLQRERDVGDRPVRVLDVTQR